MTSSEIEGWVDRMVMQPFLENTLPALVKAVESEEDLRILPSTYVQYYKLDKN